MRTRRKRRLTLCFGNPTTGSVFSLPRRRKETRTLDVQILEAFTSKGPQGENESGVLEVDPYVKWLLCTLHLLITMLSAPKC